MLTFELDDELEQTDESDSVDDSESESVELVWSDDEASLSSIFCVLLSETYKNQLPIWSVCVYEVYTFKIPLINIDSRVKRDIFTNLIRLSGGVEWVNRRGFGWYFYN